MELIIKEGINTKNCPCNTCNSIILALYNNKVSGIYLKVFKTKDNILIINSSNKIMNKNINEYNYNYLLKYNLGNKIKKYFILTLEEVFKIYNNNTKKIILNTNDLETIELIEDLSKDYNINLYIETNLKKEERSYNKIGIKLNLYNLGYINYKYDFCTIDFKNLKDYLQIYKIKKHKEVMFHNINTKKDYIELEKKTKNYIGNIYIISNNYKMFNSLHEE